MNDLEVRVKTLEFQFQGFQAAIEAIAQTNRLRTQPRLTRLENAVSALVKGNVELARHALDRRHK